MGCSRGRRRRAYRGDRRRETAPAAYRDGAAPIPACPDEKDQQKMDRSGGFFFQAEDGIRDADVTGVQTCALPISMGNVTQVTNESISGYREVRTYGAKEIEQKRFAKASNDNHRQALKFGLTDAIRSEERRVGKECRSQGLAYD